jgi:DNA repair exonuclease SbcCD ATPase subunit
MTRHRLQAAERERERLRIELQEAHRSLSKLTNDPDFHEDIREKWSSIAFWRSKAEAAEARATQLEAEFGHLRDQPIIYGSEAKKAAEAEARATQAEAELAKARQEFNRFGDSELWKIKAVAAEARATQAEADVAYWMKRATDVEFPSPPEGEKDG